jgi:uncharacterized protein
VTPRLKRSLIAAGLVGAIAYATVVGWYVAHEDEYIYHPDAVMRALADSLGLAPVPVRVTASDGVHLVGRMYRGPMPDSTALWVIYCHGSSGNVTGRAQFHQQLTRLGVSVLAVDYRGYGESEGKPDEAGINRDVEAFYRFAVDSMRIPSSKIVVYGFSLGTGPAAELAAREPVGGLVLEAPYRSLPDLGQGMYPFLPVKLVMKTRFATIDKIATITCPKLIIHSPGDRMIPYAHGRDLYEKAAPPKMFLEVRGDHNDAYRVDGHIFFGGLKTFLAQVMLNGSMSTDR